MVDGDHTTLIPAPVPEVPTMQIPILPGIGADSLPWVEPRKQGYDGPVWDATDEIFITYDKEGERALVTTGERDIWNREHSYQRTGSGKYEALRSLGGATGRVGDLGRRVTDGVAATAARVRRRLPDWAGGTGAWPEVHVDRDGNGSRQGPGSGTRDRVEDNGTRAHGLVRDAWYRPQRSRVQERSDAGHEQRVRSHRHCPGCSGHGHHARSGWGTLLRINNAWFLGWLGLWIGEFGVSFGQYIILTFGGFAVAAIFRPVWRELVNADERFTLGGRR